MLVMLAGCGESARVAEIKACAEFKLTSCKLDEDGGSLYGSVRNLCGDHITRLEIESRVYGDDGALLAVDVKVLGDLAPGERASFSLALGKETARGVTCSAEVVNGYQKP
jgi:hypothetical protein